jgi:hypothetical protein
MSKEAFKELMKQEQSVGAKDGVQAIAPGLSLSKILSDVGTELKEQWKHGSHEMASAMFTGNAYVQYARKDKVEEPEHGLPEQQQEQSRGGREL